jgi:hypothetical protein
MKLAQHFTEPPVSTSFVVIDREGHALYTRDTFEHANAICQHVLAAVAVVGSPSGVLLARVSTEAMGTSSEAVAARAARRWLYRVA